MASPTLHEQSHVLEAAESQSWLSLYNNCPREYSKEYKVKCEEYTHADYFIAAGIDVLAFNRVVMLGLKTVATEENIDDIKRRYHQAGVKRMFVQVSPHAHPENLGTMLEKAGFRHYNNWVKWYIPLDKKWKEVKKVAVLRIKPDMADAFGKIITSGFGFDHHLAALATAGIGKPGWAYFVASVDGAPAGCAAGYVHNSVCALGWAATLPEYRNRGIQNALIHYRLNHLRDAGCTLAVLETAEDTNERPSASYRNMERNGFTKAYLRKNYLYEFEA